MRNDKEGLNNGINGIIDSLSPEEKGDLADLVEGFKKESANSEIGQKENNIEFNPARKNSGEQEKLALFSIENLMDRRGKEKRVNVKSKEIFDKVCQILEKKGVLDHFTFPCSAYSHEPKKTIYWKKLKKGEKIEYGGKKRFIHLSSESNDPESPIKEVKMAVTGSPDSHHFATMRVYIKKNDIKIWRVNWGCELKNDPQPASEMELNLIENILNCLVLKFKNSKKA